MNCVKRRPVGVAQKPPKMLSESAPAVPPVGAFDRVRLSPYNACAMLSFSVRVPRLTVLVFLGGIAATAQPGARSPAQSNFVDLFNGRDLAGWVNVNTAADTWRVKDGELICSGHPIGVMRSEKQYENFVLHIEWMHMEPGGNSGVFIWSNAEPNPQSRLPNGVEVQMLELDWPKLNMRDGKMPPSAYVHGELFGVGGVKTVPDNPRGERSMSIEERALGRDQWNTYDVVAVDGVVKLAVNGVFVNGVSKATQKKGYLCLESEGAEIHFRNIRIVELPPGVSR